jgi:acyl-CoA thioesterase FadM
MPEGEADKFRLEDPRVFPFERFPKIPPVADPFIMQRPVEWMDLDSYEHVNNVIYVNYAEEAAAQDFSSRGWSPAKLAEANLAIAPRRVQIQYLSLGIWGETLAISTHQLQVHATGGSRYVGMSHADGSLAAECIIDWELVDRKSGEARPLPDELR